MKLNANKLALAVAISFAVLWVICSLLVVSLPNQSMHVSNAMMHSSMSWRWDMQWLGLLIGLIAWSLTAGVSAWLIATIYNRLLDGSKTEESHE